MSQPQSLDRLLALSFVERQVFDFLNNDERQSIAGISQELSLPRMTVHDAIQKLHGRGLLRAVRVGKRRVWKRTRPEKVVQQLQGISNVLLEAEDGLVGESSEVHVSQGADVKVHTGAEKMFQVYKTQLARHKRVRVFVIQSGSSAKAALNSIPSNAWEEVNRTIGANKLIVEAVVTEDMMELYKEQSDDWIKSMEKRLAATRVVPEKFFSVAAELLLFPGMYIMADWEQGVLLEVKQENMHGAMRALYESLFALGKPLDLHGFLREIKM